MDQGSTTVESTIIILVLMLLIIGSIEFGHALWTNSTMLLAIQQAGRSAMISTDLPTVTCGAQSQAPSCPTASDTPLANCTAEFARQVLSSYQAGNVSLSVNEDQTSTPATITICASHSFSFAAPGLLAYGPLNLRSQVTVPLLGRQ
jgi:Flp pilus assembly protein TadG